MLSINKVIEKRLLTKKDFLRLAKNMYPMLRSKGHYITDKHIKQSMEDFKKMKVSELREIFQKTHIIDCQLKNYRGHCFSCLTSLRHDYTSKLDKNYCIDCL